MKHKFEITFELDSQQASIDNCIVKRDGWTMRIIGAFPINDTMGTIKDILVDSLEDIEW